jgi:hypothetical protein
VRSQYNITHLQDGHLRLIADALAGTRELTAVDLRFVSSQRNPTACL